jgi:hypothetical protein
LKRIPSHGSIRTKVSSNIPPAPLRPPPSANRLGESARHARRRGDRKQGVVKLNVKVPVRDKRSADSRRSFPTFSEFRNRGRFIGGKLTQHRKQFCRAAAHRRTFLVL